ncbi:MAG: hypothetical protein ABFC67_10540, partial [Mizugakiibacter sp.]|uniref:hypothetical protein n=1 Tax=Mizugakiibacter sp. TaxID=1972610 RepID=UPI00321027AF
LVADAVLVLVWTAGVLYAFDGVAPRLALLISGAVSGVSGVLVRRGIAALLRALLLLVRVWARAHDPRSHLTPAAPGLENPEPVFDRTQQLRGNITGATVAAKASPTRLVGSSR